MSKWLETFDEFNNIKSNSPVLLCFFAIEHPEYIERCKRAVLEVGSYADIHKAYVKYDWWNDANLFIESLIFFRKGRKDIMLKKDLDLISMVAEEMPGLTEAQREWLRMQL